MRANIRSRHYVILKLIYGSRFLTADPLGKPYDDPRRSVGVGETNYIRARKAVPLVMGSCDDDIGFWKSLFRKKKTENIGSGSSPFFLSILRQNNADGSVLNRRRNGI